MVIFQFYIFYLNLLRFKRMFGNENWSERISYTHSNIVNGNRFPFNLSDVHNKSFIFEKCQENWRARKALNKYAMPHNNVAI